VHTPADIVKSLLAGADAVQVVAALLVRGPGRLGELLKGLTEWMEAHEYDSVEQMIGASGLRNCPDLRGLRARQLPEDPPALAGVGRCRDRFRNVAAERQRWLLSGSGCLGPLRRATAAATTGKMAAPVPTREPPGKAGGAR